LPAYRRKRPYHLGIVFDDKDMKRFANTFVNVLWNKDEAQPEFRSHVDFKYGTPAGKSHLLRWLWLYEFDPQVGKLVGQYYANHPEIWLSEAVANLACWQAAVRPCSPP